MNPFIVFDVTPASQLSQVISELRKMEYHLAWMSNGIRYDLPSNCVWKPNVELEAAYKDIQGVITSLNSALPEGAKIALGKCIVLSNTPWIGKSSDVTPI